MNKFQSFHRSPTVHTYQKRKRKISHLLSMVDPTEVLMPFLIIQTLSKLTFVNMTWLWIWDPCRTLFFFVCGYLSFFIDIFYSFHFLSKYIREKEESSEMWIFVRIFKNKRRRDYRKIMEAFKMNIFTSNCLLLCGIPIPMSFLGSFLSGSLWPKKFELWRIKHLDADPHPTPIHESMQHSYNVISWLCDTKVMLLWDICN